MKRYIRLKEFRPNQSTEHIPSDKYLEGTDRSNDSGPFYANADENGFLSTGNILSLGQPEIVFLGDSFVESLYSQERNRFVSLVERGLRVDGQNFRCLNGGYSGSNSLQLLSSLLNKIYPSMGPGAVVVVFGCHSDADSLFDRGSYWNNRRVTANILNNEIPGKESIPGGRASHSAILKSIIDVASNLDLNLVLATTPHRVAPYDEDELLRRRFKNSFARYQTYMERRSEYNDTIRDIAEEKQVPLIDCASNENCLPKYFYDELHLNPLGQTKISEELISALQEIIPKL